MTRSTEKYIKTYILALLPFLVFFGGLVLLHPYEDRFVYLLVILFCSFVLFLLLCGYQLIELWDIN